MPIDVPHDLVYDPNDKDVQQLIKRYRANDSEHRGCAIAVTSLNDGFFDLEVDC